MLWGSGTTKILPAALSLAQRLRQHSKTWIIHKLHRRLYENEDCAKKKTLVQKAMEKGKFEKNESKRDQSVSSSSFSRVDLQQLSAAWFGVSLSNNSPHLLMNSEHLWKCTQWNVVLKLAECDIRWACICLAPSLSSLLWHQCQLQGLIITMLDIWPTGVL